MHNLMTMFLWIRQRLPANLQHEEWPVNIKRSGIFFFCFIALSHVLKYVFGSWISEIQYRWSEINQLQNVGMFGGCATVHNSFWSQRWDDARKQQNKKIVRAHHVECNTFVSVVGMGLFFNFRRKNLLMLFWFTVAHCSLPF